MPNMIATISYQEAAQVVEAILQRARQDGGEPVAVAVVNSAARLVCFAAMDGVMPASIRLCQSKAYSAVVGQRDTQHWAQIPKHAAHIDFDMYNWTDHDFTGFTGGVVLRVSTHVAGGIGVSGRKGTMGADDEIQQDVELATFGRTAFEDAKG